MLRTVPIILLTLVASSVVNAWTVPLEPAVPDDSATALYAAQAAISLARATELALERYPGQVVRAETVMRGGRREHSIRILGADGRVRTVRIDAQSGAFL